MDQAYGVLKCKNGKGDYGFHGTIYTSLEIAKESFRLRHPEIEFFCTNETIGIWGMKLPDKEMKLKLLPVEILSEPKPW